MARIFSYSGPDGSFLLNQDGLPVRMGLGGVIIGFFQKKGSRIPGVECRLNKDLIRPDLSSLVNFPAIR
jgi:hypothetical protein